METPLNFDGTEYKNVDEMTKDGERIDLSWDLI